MRFLIAAAVLASLPALAQPAKAPFTAVENLTPEKAVRHVSGQELSETMKKGMGPGAFYSQIMLSKHDGYQIINTIRDKDGQAEIHADWNDNLFVQEGEASFVTGGIGGGCQDHGAGRTARHRHQGRHHRDHAGGRLFLCARRHAAPDESGRRPAYPFHRFQNS